MASTTLINAQTTNAKSTATEITGENTIVVKNAKMNDRVLIFLDDTPSGVIDSPPWARSLITGKVDLRVNTVNRSGNAITITVESTA
jgi:hypothetical protein